MDAVEYLRAVIRMCESHDQCRGCPFEDHACSGSSLEYYPEESVDIVEQWLKENKLVENV